MNSFVVRGEITLTRFHDQLAPGFLRNCGYGKLAKIPIFCCSCCASSAQRKKKFIVGLMLQSTRATLAFLLNTYPGVNGMRTCCGLFGVGFAPASGASLISLMNAGAFLFHCDIGTVLFGYGVPPIARPDESRTIVAG